MSPCRHLLPLAYLCPPLCLSFYIPFAYLFTPVLLLPMFFAPPSMSFCTPFFLRHLFCVFCTSLPVFLRPFACLYPPFLAVIFHPLACHFTSAALFSPFLVFYFLLSVFLALFTYACLFCNPLPVFLLPPFACFFHHLACLFTSQCLSYYSPCLSFFYFSQPFFYTPTSSFFNLLAVFY